MSFLPSQSLPKITMQQADRHLAHTFSAESDTQTKNRCKSGLETGFRSAPEEPALNWSIGHETDQPYDDKCLTLPDEAKPRSESGSLKVRGLSALSKARSDVSMKMRQLSGEPRDKLKSGSETVRSVSLRLDRSARKKKEDTPPDCSDQESASGSDKERPRQKHSLNMLPLQRRRSSSDNQLGATFTTDRPRVSESEDHLSLESSTDSPREQQSNLGERRRKAIKKIEVVRERLRNEAVARESDVEEYIWVTQGLPMTPDHPQLIRIRQVFEKKNKKHASTLEQLQKRLETLQHRLHELDDEFHGSLVTSKSLLHRKPEKSTLTNLRSSVKGLGQNLKGTLGEYKDSVMAAPRELVSSLPKRRSGSADDIHAAVNKSAAKGLLVGLKPSFARKHHAEEPTIQSKLVGHSQFYTDLLLPAVRYDSAFRHSASTHQDLNKTTSVPHRHPEALLTSSRKLQKLLGYDQFEQVSPRLHQQIISQMGVLEEQSRRFEETLDTFRTQMHGEFISVSRELSEVKFLCQRLEIQMNDAVELQQAEVMNLKSELEVVTSRIEYQHDERFRELHDLAQSCQLRMLELERQLQVRDQSRPELDGANAYALRGINIFIILPLQFVLMVASMLALMAQPFVRNRSRAMASLTLIVFVLAGWKYKWMDLVAEKLFRKKNSFLL